MTKFKVTVERCRWEFAEIEVEAEFGHEAEDKAMDIAKDSYNETVKWRPSNQAEDPELVESEEVVEPVKVVHRTRAWESEFGSSTIIQFRTDRIPMVYLHSNIGWIPIDNTPGDEAAAEKLAEEMAAGYELEEVTIHRARWLAGWPS